MRLSFLKKRVGRKCAQDFLFVLRSRCPTATSTSAGSGLRDSSFWGVSSRAAVLGNSWEATKTVLQLTCSVGLFVSLDVVEADGRSSKVQFLFSNNIGKSWLFHLTRFELCDRQHYAPFVQNCNSKAVFLLALRCVDSALFSWYDASWHGSNQTYSNRQCGQINLKTHVEEVWHQQLALQFRACNVSHCCTPLRQVLHRSRKPKRSL